MSLFKILSLANKISSKFDKSARRDSLNGIENCKGMGQNCTHFMPGICKYLEIK